MPITKRGSTVAITMDAMPLLSSDERQFGRSEATWIHQAKQESLATVYINYKWSDKTQVSVCWTRLAMQTFKVTNLYLSTEHCISTNG